MMIKGKNFSPPPRKFLFPSWQSNSWWSELRRVALCNLGCSKNMVDGERILQWFCNAGFIPESSFEVADIIVVNTCAFIREATQEAIDTILEMARWKEKGRCRMLLVAGCFSQRYGAEAAKQIPEVDRWIPLQNWEGALQEIFRGLDYRPSSFQRYLTNHYGGQYLKIAEGCSNRCSFCVIPAIRGGYRSRPMEEIIREAQWLYEQGVRECILVSQDTSYYGRDLGFSLVALVERLLAAVAFPWIRLMYLNPQWVDEALVRLIASEKRLCSYYDLPLQHCVDPLLRKMGRKPLVSGIRRLLEQIRTLDPRGAIRTSFIIGFPGETERHFRSLLRFVEEIRFDKVGVFPYSPEEGTPAATFRPRPRDSTVMRRCEELMALQRDISRELLLARKGTFMQVMIDGKSDHLDYQWEGRTEFDAPEVDGRVFIFARRPLRKGLFATVRIVETDDYDLYGQAS